MTNTTKQAQMSDEEILALAHRYCTAYSHGEHEPYSFSDRHIIDFVRLRIEPVIASKRDAGEALPTVPKNSQDWANLDGAVAWHLIERHADNWADVGLMMDEWLKAQTHPPIVPTQEE